MGRGQHGSLRPGRKRRDATFRELSLWLSVLGGLALLAAAGFLVSVGWGESSTTTAGPGGTVVTETHRTASALESSPHVAIGWLLAVLAFSILAGLLIRFGGRVGGALVVAIVGLGTFASLLTIGVVLAPGAALLGAAALLAELDRSERRRLATPQPGSTPIRPMTER